MATRTDLKMPYGISDFKRIRSEGFYYVDKTEYLARMETRDSFVFFVRPRRFGKSLFLDMLRLYYDRNEKDNFEKLFGGLWIGAHPTPNRNRYLMLKADALADKAIHSREEEMDWREFVKNDIRLNHCIFNSFR